jgi:hypothetical protein
VHGRPGTGNGAWSSMPRPDGTWLKAFVAAVLTPHSTGPSSPGPTVT